MNYTTSKNLRDDGQYYFEKDFGGYSISYQNFLWRILNFAVVCKTILV